MAKEKNGKKGSSKAKPRARALKDGDVAKVSGGLTDKYATWKLKI